MNALPEPPEGWEAHAADQAKALREQGAERDALRARVARLEGALRLLQESVHETWCGRSESETPHGYSCAAARAALARGEGEDK